MQNSNPKVKTIFDDLDKYRDFCRMYGYSFDEGDLYNTRSYSYRQYQKLLAGKKAKNQWEVDLARYKERQASR